MNRLKRALLWTAGLLLVVAAAVVFWQIQRLRSQPKPAFSVTALSMQLERLHALCVQDMVASTCKVMGTTTGASPPAKPGELVFIAGVGAVDALEYQKMYQAGEAMCTVVRKACSDDWQSNQCQTARRLLMGP